MRTSWAGVESGRSFVARRLLPAHGSRRRSWRKTIGILAFVAAGILLLLLLGTVFRGIEPL
jgi:ferric-dicitrate binding protein FerR (iron transport regulator)